MSEDYYEYTYYKSGSIATKKMHKKGDLSKNGKKVLHSYNDLPAFVEYNYYGGVCLEVWYKDGKKHREPGLNGQPLPAKILYEIDKKKCYERWYQNGKLHRDSGPAIIDYHSNGTIAREQWYKNGYLHSYSNTETGEDQPAWISYYQEVYGTNKTVLCKTWYKNGVKHRDGDKPASIEYHDGKIVVEQYYKNGLLNRDDDSILGIDLPAYIIYKSDPAWIDNKPSTFEWYKNGVKHRDLAPAKIHYWENDEIYCEEYYHNGKNCRLNQDGTLSKEPTYICYNENGSKFSEIWYNMDGKIHREYGPSQYGTNSHNDRPSSVYYSKDNNIEVKYYHTNGRISNFFGPSYIEYDVKEPEKIKRKVYYIDDEEYNDYEETKYYLITYFIKKFVNKIKKKKRAKLLNELELRSNIKNVDINKNITKYIY